MVLKPRSSRDRRERATTMLLNDQSIPAAVSKQHSFVPLSQVMAHWNVAVLMTLPLRRRLHSRLKVDDVLLHQPLRPWTLTWGGDDANSR